MSLLKQELSVPSIQEGAATRDGAANAVAQMIARINTSGRLANQQPDICPPSGAHSKPGSKLDADSPPQVSKSHAETQDRHRRIRPENRNCIPLGVRTMRMPSPSTLPGNHGLNNESAL